MAITHFKILEIPDPISVISRKGSSSIQLDTLYPIAEESELNFRRVTDLRENPVRARLKYVLYDNVNNIYGNTAYATIAWITTDVPGGSDLGITILNQKTRLRNYLLMTPGTEFFVIDSIFGVNIFHIYPEPEPSLYKIELFPGMRLEMDDFFKTYMTPEVSGGGQPYSTLRYKVGGTVGGFEHVYPTVYELIVNIDSSAELKFRRGKEVIDNDVEFDDDPVPGTFNVKTERFFCQITKGMHRKHARVNVNIASPFLELNDWNYITIFNGVNEITIDSDDIFDVMVPLNHLGIGVLEVTNYIKEDSMVPKTGTIELELLSIDGRTSRVSSTNSLTLNTNY